MIHIVQQVRSIWDLDNCLGIVVDKIMSNQNNISSASESEPIAHGLQRLPDNESTCLLIIHKLLSIIIYSLLIIALSFYYVNLLMCSLNTFNI